MTAKEYLSQAYRIDQRINSKLEQIQSLRRLLTKVNSTLDDMPGNPNRDRSFVEEYLVKIVDLEREIDSEIDRLVTIKADIMRAISAVDDAECRDVLEGRYLRHLTWESLAMEMAYSVRNVQYIHGKALGKISVPE